MLNVGTFDKLSTSCISDLLIVRRIVNCNAIRVRRTQYYLVCHAVVQSYLNNFDDIIIIAEVISRIMT